MKKAYLYIIAILIVANIVAVFMWRSFHAGRPSNPRIDPRKQAVAMSYQKYGVMSEDTYYRIEDLNQQVAKSGKISDNDVNWLTSLLSQKSKFPGLVESKVFAVFLSLTSLPPEQENAIYTATIPIVQKPDPADPDNLGKRFAVTMLGKLRDKRGIPDLVPLLQSPDPAIRQRAAKALASMGYTHVSPA